VCISTLERRQLQAVKDNKSKIIFLTNTIISKKMCACIKQLPNKEIATDIKM
jgi:hypothetical protein